MINSSLSPISISIDTLEHNVELVRQHLFKQMKSSLDIGSQLIHEEMSGISILLRPIVKAFYSKMVQKDLEHGTRKSINGTLKMTKQMVIDGVDPQSEEFYRRLEDKFPGYLKNDQTGRQCKQNHPNFTRLRENLKKTFEAQVLGIYPFLTIENDVKDYYELCRCAFPTANECKAILKDQTDHMIIGQNIIKEDLSILDIPSPAARAMIFRVLQKGFNAKIEEFNIAIDNIYNFA
ncbi:hypothetical protein [Candidatus Lokiarchaeum ossiferum]|uniref:hypothetical protein n=1 Tax=Candidatus Lokiarchaeum ossiferum TaxID=2951803 RepID=UPI00352F7D2B